jgi:hypothetical protein
VKNASGRDSLQRALIGFLLAAALFLVEAGWGEIFLSTNQSCVATLRGIRLAPDPSEACGSEFQLYLAASFSTGLVGLFRPEAPSGVAWIVMGMLYGLAGAGFAQLKPRHAVAGYLVAHLVLVMGLVAANYLSQFIV